MSLLAIFQRPRALLALSLLGTVLTPSATFAQQYPEKAVTVIVPFAPGGSTDLITRLISAHLSKSLGQPFVVQNYSGAGGSIGTAKGARAPADGYTIMAGTSGSHASVYSAYKSLSYSPASFESIGLTAIIPGLIVVNNDMPIHSLIDLVQFTKAHPGKVSFGHPGIGTSGHLQCEFLKRETKTDIQLVAYRGAGAMMTDLMAGQINGGCDAPPSSMAAVKSGHVRAIAVMGRDRSAVMADVPTTEEQGMPELQAPTWTALFAPKNTPKPVLEKLSNALNLALDDPEISNRITKLGANVPTPKQRGQTYTDDFVRTEVAKWGDLAKAASIPNQ